MSEIKTLQNRNQQFSATFRYGELSKKPAFSTVIVTCVDARIDPAHFLKLEPGEVITFRNTGGRITADTERELAALWFMGKQMGGNLEIALIHHTDCGTESFANPQLKQGLTKVVGLSEDDVEQRVIHNHQESIQDDIARLKISSFISDDIVVSAHLYHTDTGHMEQIIAPTALKDC